MGADAAALVQDFAASEDELCICLQSLIEFWAVATRPRDANGLGLEPDEALQMSDFREIFTLLPEPHDIAERCALVGQNAVRGKTAHDARIVALTQAHGIDKIATFNQRDFRRYPGLTLINPSSR
jgi:predicted nucleic acid-binding protein